MTVTCALPATTEVMVGAPGIVAGITAAEATDDDPVPTLLVAVTEQVYTSPLISPATTIGLEAPDAVACRFPVMQVAV